MEAEPDRSDASVGFSYDDFRKDPYVNRKGKFVSDAFKTLSEMPEKRSEEFGKIKDKALKMT